MKEQDRRLTGECSKFLKRKKEVEKLHKELIKEEISVIKPLGVLNRINKEFLKGKGKVTKQSFPYLKIFDLSWTECYVELSDYRRHQITISFYPFLIEPNQVIKNVDQLLSNDTDTPKGTVHPGFVVLGGSEAKAIKDDWGNIVGVKNVFSLNPNLSTVFEIPTRLEEINKANLIKEIKPSFEEALRKAYRNSALKE